MDDAERIPVFDRALVRRRRERAARRGALYHVLSEEAGASLAERIADVKGGFSSVLNIGASGRTLVDALAASGRVRVVTADLSETAASRTSGAAVVFDDEDMPFAPGSFDLIVSNLVLHWVNDVPGALAQIKRALRPRGMFLAALVGGDSLCELRASLLEAELEASGGISPRMSPAIDMKDAAALLQRAGFSLPVTDQETMTLTYPDLRSLMHDLRGMAATNAHVLRLRHFTRRSVFETAERLYRARFAMPCGHIPATFKIIFLHGWSESPE